MSYLYCCCTCIFILSSSLITQARISEDECRRLEFTAARVLHGQRLMNHVIRRTDVTNKEFCGALCFLELKCVSYNLLMAINENGKHKCELNNATYEENTRDMEEDPSYEYLGAENACAKVPCKNEATCQTGFTHKGYRCLCPAGFTGQDCESDIDECLAGTSSCDADADCFNTKGSYTCSCKTGYQGDGKTCEDVDECTRGTHNCIENDLCENTVGSFKCLTWSCEELYNRNVTSGGGWKLVMKIDGTKPTFRYDSPFWSNQDTFNPAAGETGFDTHETKLSTYWNTSFTKICLGMKIPGEEAANFITLDKSANSLYSLIEDGQYRATSVGRETWKSLLGSQGSLQRNCEKEGFNAVCKDAPNNSKARIGIIADNEADDCDSCDSRIGFGTGGHPNNANTCGVEAQTYVDNGHKHIKAMGYILIQ